jgi:hypothetical protein
MKQSYFDNSLSRSSLLFTKIHYLVHKSIPHIFKSFLTPSFCICLPSVLFKYSNQNFINTSHIFHACYMYRPQHTSWCHHCSTCWRVQTLSKCDFLFCTKGIHVTKVSFGNVHRLPRNTLQCRSTEFTTKIYCHSWLRDHCTTNSK